jgi:hypothetical protein
MTRKAVLSLLILTLVVVVAAWSKLRFVGREGYDEPQRWRVQDYPGLQDGNHAGTAGRGSATAGG